MKLIVDIPDNIYDSAKDITNDGVRSMFICGNIKGKPYHEARQGKWIDYSDTDGYIECSFCHVTTVCKDNIGEFHYCWNCGAKLEKGGAE